MFYIVDVTVGLALPVFLWLRHRSAPERGGVMPAFWLGFAVGMLWELPIFLSATYATQPIVRFIVQPPVHPLVVMVAHASWDGGLFLAGLVLIQIVNGREALTSFRWPALFTFLVWGQVSAFAVEAVSGLASGWAYDDAFPGNPVLFELGGHPITLLPQVIWLVAPIVYYVTILRLGRRARTTT